MTNNLYLDKVPVTIWWNDQVESKVMVLDASTSSIPPGTTGTISSSAYTFVQDSSIIGPEGIGVYPLFDRDGDGISDLVEATNEVRSWWGGANYFRTTVPDEDPSLAGGTTTNGFLKGGVKLPQEGIGYYHLHGSDDPDEDNWGTLKLIKVLEQAGREWNQLHPEGPRIGIVDLSLEHGGNFCWCKWYDYLYGTCDAAHSLCHEHHQKGLNADIRFVRSDKKEFRYNFNDEDEPYPSYDQSMTQELVNFLCEAGVTLIYADNRAGLNTDAWPECEISDYPGHHHHFHIVVGYP